MIGQLVKPGNHLPPGPYLLDQHTVQPKPDAAQLDS